MVSDPWHLDAGGSSRDWEELVPISWRRKGMSICRAPAVHVERSLHHLSLGFWKATVSLPFPQQTKALKLREAE